MNCGEPFDYDYCDLEFACNVCQRFKDKHPELSCTEVIDLVEKEMSNKETTNL